MVGEGDDIKRMFFVCLFACSLRFFGDYESNFNVMEWSN